MIYREFGKTGKKVSLLGFGGMRFKPEDLNDEAGLNRCADIVRYASKQGVNYFDTAPEYAQGKEELIFRRAFEDIPNHFFVASKSKISSEKTADDVLRRINKSLDIMGISTINFYSMWSIMGLDHYKKVISEGGPYQGALEAKKQGLIEHIIFSAHCTPDEIITMINDGLFEGVVISFNILNYGSMLRILESASEKNIGVITMNSLGGGVIPQNPDYFRTLLMSNDENSLVSHALQFNSSFKEISVVLSGMTSIKEVSDNSEAFSTNNIGNYKKIPFVDKISPELNSLCVGCGYCNVCPEKIPIPQYMQSYNYHFFPDADFMGATIQWFEENRRMANNVFQRLRVNYGIIPETLLNPCKKCGQCEQICTQRLPIITRIDEIYSWVKKHNYCLESLILFMERVFIKDKVQKIGLYPAGAYTESIIKFFKKKFGEPSFDLYIFDSNSSLWGERIDTYPICSPGEILNLGVERVIITNLRYQDDIYNKLQYLEDSGISIIKFHGKNDLFWF
jgi:hypothetical protein